jgi:ssDNA-binding Zn-finger/Zn-ribbon topoisomerase 1
MRLLRRLVLKLIKMAIVLALMGAVMRFARPYIMKSAGMPEGMPGIEGVQEAHFSSEESDLMGTVFKSALRFVTGSAKKEELAGELSDKLYAGRADSKTMSELGIELVKPGGADPSAPAGLGNPLTSSSAPVRSASTANSKPGAILPAKAGASSAMAPASAASAISPASAPKAFRQELIDKIWEKSLANPELALVPIVLVGMILFRIRRKRSLEDEYVLPDLSALIPTETEGYEMTHRVHSLSAEDFELLVALIYQRQGYRVSMPAGLSGGRGGDFTVIKKSERLLVQCKKLSPDHKVHVDRVRELYDAAVAAGVTRGVYVATCSFSWDARNFAKTKGVTVINAQMLDTLLTTARQNPDEDFLAVSEWAPKVMSKVKLTPPLCPACEAPMDEIIVSNGSHWLCSERPECRGRRSARKLHKPGSDTASNETSKTVLTEASKAEAGETPKAEATTAPKAAPNKSSKAASNKSPKAASNGASKAVSNNGSKAETSGTPKIVLNGASKALSNAISKAVSSAALKAKAAAKAQAEKLATSDGEEPPEPVVLGGRARTITPSASARR